jgi:hypothetical protein
LGCQHIMGLPNPNRTPTDLPHFLFSHPHQFPYPPELLRNRIAVGPLLYSSSLNQPPKHRPRIDLHLFYQPCKVLDGGVDVRVVVDTGESIPFVELCQKSG